MVSTRAAVPWGGGEDGRPLLVPGTLRGYRLMTVVSLERRPAFLSLRGGWTGWITPELTAECLAPRRGVIWHAPHHDLSACLDSPGNDCFCGIYNGYDPSFESLDRPSFHWVAVTANWGKIILGPHGFRAAHARLLAVAPRQGSLEHWTQFQSAADTAPWRQQHHFMLGFGVHVLPSLSQLVRAYPPDDASHLRPTSAAA